MNCPPCLVLPPVFAQVSVDFRTHLHAFKGAPLAVFLAITLHSDERGWASHSITTLARETGFGKDAVSDALAYLCKLRVDGHRVLMRGQPRDRGGKFFNNSYLIFPTDEEATSSPHRGFPDTVEPETVKAEITRTILNQNQLDEDDVARAAQREADALLERWGIENPVRDELLDRLSTRQDSLAIIYDVCHGTVAQWARRTGGKHAIHSPAGLIVSRLRNFDLSSPVLDLAWVRGKHDARS
jgi:hypothetical protein